MAPVHIGGAISPLLHADVHATKAELDLESSLRAADLQHDASVVRQRCRLLAADESDAGARIAVGPDNVGGAAQIRHRPDQIDSRDAERADADSAQL